jgi:hypothetical protein
MQRLSQQTTKLHFCLQKTPAKVCLKPPQTDAGKRLRYSSITLKAPVGRFFIFCDRLLPAHSTHLAVPFGNERDAIAL